MQAHPLPGVTAVILAGGFGTRVRHLLPGIPKPMAPVLGRPFLDWVLAFLRREGVASAVLSTGHLAEVVATHYASGFSSAVLSPDQPGEVLAPHAGLGVPDGIRVQCVHEATPLGTAGGFLHAALSSQDAGSTKAWLVLNGDSLTVTHLRPLLDLVEDPDVDGGLLAVDLPDASRFGTLEVDANGWLRRFREKQPGAGLINAGVYLLKTPLLLRAPQERPLSFETELFPRLIESGARLRVIPCDAAFLDIGTPATLQQAEQFVRDSAAWF